MQDIKERYIVRENCYIQINIGKSQTHEEIHKFLMKNRKYFKPMEQKYMVHKINNMDINSGSKDLQIKFCEKNCTMICANTQK